MMKKVILFISLALTSSLALHAQSDAEGLEYVEQKFIIPINYSRIQEVARNDSTYKALVAQYEQADEALGLFDIATVYYGFAFRPEYKGNMDVVESPVERLIQEGNFENLWNQGLAYLRDNPVSLITLQYIIIAGNAMQKPEDQMNTLMKRFNNLLLMIYQTGDGYTQETAYKVLSITDQQIFMRRVLGVESHANRYLTPANVDRYDVVRAKNFDRRYLFIDASLAHHFGPKWEPEDIPEMNDLQELPPAE